MVGRMGVELEGVAFRIGTFRMEGLSLSIRRGEYFVLTGRNGAGKTLLIRLIAGLQCPEAGTIRINGRVVNDVPPWQRNVGYLPQDGVLFPNRTVGGNIAFGLEVRGVAKGVMAEEVARVAEMLGIGHLLDRDPVGLSGGERQKAGLARALILKPVLLLLDEPVSAIDEDTRDAVCRELRAIQRRLQLTMLHVSHNTRETALVADRIGVMSEGRIVRIAAGNGQ